MRSAFCAICGTFSCSWPPTLARPAGERAACAWTAPAACWTVGFSAVARAIFTIWSYFSRPARVPATKPAAKPATKLTRYKRIWTSPDCSREALLQ